MQYRHGMISLFSVLSFTRFLIRFNQRCDSPFIHQIRSNPAIPPDRLESSAHSPNHRDTSIFYRTILSSRTRQRSEPANEEAEVPSHRYKSHCSYPLIPQHLIPTSLSAYPARTRPRKRICTYNHIFLSFLCSTA